MDKIENINSKQSKSFFGIIMRNESLMIYNKYLSLNHITEPLDEQLFIIDESADIDEILAKAELKRKIQIYLDELNSDDRNILILKYIKDYSNDEIARFLNITQETLRQRLSRARKKIAEKISNSGGKEAIND